MTQSDWKFLAEYWKSLCRGCQTAYKIVLEENIELKRELQRERTARLANEWKEEHSKTIGYTFRDIKRKFDG